MSESEGVSGILCAFSAHSALKGCFNAETAEDPQRSRGTRNSRHHHTHRGRH